MNENKIIAAILTIATSARESRGTSEETGKENWRTVINTMNKFLPNWTMVQSRTQGELLYQQVFRAANQVLKK